MEKRRCWGDHSLDVIGSGSVGLCRDRHGLDCGCVCRWDERVSVSEVEEGRKVKEEEKREEGEFDRTRVNKGNPDSSADEEARGLIGRFGRWGNMAKHSWIKSNVSWGGRNNVN